MKGLWRIGKFPVGIARNPRHLHFMIFVESFDPALARSRGGTGKVRRWRSITRALSQTILSFPHKYPCEGRFPSLSISSDIPLCIIRVIYVPWKKQRDAHYRDKNWRCALSKSAGNCVLFYPLKLSCTEYSVETNTFLLRIHFTYEFRPRIYFKL